MAKPKNFSVTIWEGGSGGSIVFRRNKAAGGYGQLCNDRHEDEISVSMPWDMWMRLAEEIYRLDIQGGLDDQS